MNKVIQGRIKITCLQETKWQEKNLHKLKIQKKGKEIDYGLQEKKMIEIWQDNSGQLIKRKCRY